MNYLKDNLKALIKSQDKTIAQLARATEIAPQTLNNWMAGQEPRSLTQVKVVADYFSITIDELCFNNSPSTNNTEIENFNDEINAGIFEVVLRRVKK